MLVGLSYKFINKECIETKTKWCKSHETYDNCWCFAYPYTPSDISEEQFVKHVTTGKNFTPAIFEKQYRKKANFKSASLVGLDFDNGISTNDLIQHTYSWLFWFVYATASSKPEYPKSRAIIRLDQPITDVKEYESVVKGLIRLFSINDPDDKAKDASRMFYGSVTTDFKLIGNIVTLEQVKKVMPKDVAKDQSTHKPYPTFATGKELLKRNGNGNRYLPEVAKEIEEKLGIARIGVNSEGFVEKQLSCPFLAHEHDSERPASGWHREKMFLHCFKCDTDYTAYEVANALGIETTRAKIYHTDDSGNAQRFIDQYGNKTMYVPKFGCWYIWNGYYWQKDENQIMTLAQDVATNIFDEAKLVSDNLEQQRKLSSWAITSRNTYRLRSMVEAASWHLSVSHDQLDNDNMLLGVKNGVIDLKNGKLIAANPKQHITQQVNALYNPDAKYPKFLNFLHSVMNDDEMVRYIQKLIGYTLTGISNQKIMMLVYGPKDTGKTLLVNILGALFGDYAKYVNASTLMRSSKKGGSDATPDIARLRGARLVYCDESEQGDYLNAALVKQLTGRSKRTARFLFGELFEYEPTDKIWLATNYMPGIPTDDKAAWDRIRIIEFKNVIAEKDQNKLLQDEIIANELSGILNFAIEGCLAYQTEGLNEPDFAKASKHKVYQEQDTIGQFLELAIKDSAEWISRNEMYSLYKTWCTSEDIRPFGKKRFNEHLRVNLGYQENQQKGIWGWKALGFSLEAKMDIENAVS